MAPRSSGLFIIHLPNPVHIIEVHEGEIKPNLRVPPDEPYLRAVDGKGQPWTLAVHFMFSTDFLKEPREQAGPLLAAAWRWFRAYLDKYGHPDVVTYIRDAGVFNLSSLEAVTELPKGTLIKAVKGTRDLPELSQKKLLYFLNMIGVTPSN